MAVNDRLQRYLDQERASYDTLPHREVFTAHEVAADSHMAERQVAKVLTMLHEDLLPHPATCSDGS